MAKLRGAGALLGGCIRSSPAVVPAGLALGVLVVLAATQGGYYPLDWYPGAVFVFGLLLVALLAVPAAASVPRPVLVAVALLAGYAAWSYASIAWADQPGRAWDGANVTALYAIVFSLFALWPLREAPAAILLGGLTLAISVLGLVELLAVDPGAEPGASFVDGRFSAPVGYSNGNVALWTTALLPALALGSRREVPAPLRPLFLACAGLLAGLALMGQSRGWLFALAPIAVAFVAVSAGGRIRAVIAVALVGLATTAIGGTLLDVRDAVYETGALGPAVDDATGAIALSALGLALAGLVWALLDRRVRVSRGGARAAGIVVTTAVLLAAGIGLGVFTAREGSPVTALSDAWDEFKTGPRPGGEENRFSGSLGSNRYDFWRVAWAEFRENPVTGIGAENFQQPYLERGKSRERPRHPHSVPLRVLSQTGLVGILLLGAGLAAAFLAAAAALRRRSGLAAVAAAGGTAAALYWLIHGAVDWFWELPALGAAAFALLGLACSLAPREAREERRPLVADVRPLVVTLVVAAVVGIALLRPWLSEVYVERAAGGWREDPAEAFDDLERASDLNPLAVTPPLVEAGIASRLELLERAEPAFREALDRDSRNAYAMLNLGIVEWELGREAQAIERVEDTLRVDPRYTPAREVLRSMRNGELLDVNEVNRRIRQRAQRLGR